MERDSFPTCSSRPNAVHIRRFVGLKSQERCSGASSSRTATLIRGEVPGTMFWHEVRLPGRKNHVDSQRWGLRNGCCTIENFQTIVLQWGSYQN
eukprot:9472082-Pyramimonas_sp.AAC.1